LPAVETFIARGRAVAKQLGYRIIEVSSLRGKTRVGGGMYNGYYIPWDKLGIYYHHRGQGKCMLAAVIQLSSIYIQRLHNKTYYECYSMMSPVLFK